jgi:hypothetical protein
MNNSKGVLSLVTAFFIIFSSSPFLADDVSKQSSIRQVLDVYKSPTCGCCKEWMKHLKTNGIDTNGYHPDDMSAFKTNKGIAREYQSCHTAVSKSGFVFEGHVPAKYIQQFLASPPDNAIGLAVPAMPVGSPGMEYQDRFMPYKVLQLNKDGTSLVYAHVKYPSQQY